jgi:hypothetical protein
MRTRTLAASIAAALLITVGFAGTAQATPGAKRALQAQVDQVLAKRPGGVQTAPNQVSWYGGKVVLTLPDKGTGLITPATSGTGACGSGWYCFYENKNFNTGLFNDGRMIRLTGCDGIPGNLTDYGFNDMTSSWYNHTNFAPVWVYRDINGVGLLWTMSAQTMVVYVGDANNDKASSLNCN